MQLIYIHDPMCSWCWAFAPAWKEIQAKLPQGVETLVLLGGLAPDSDEPMPDQMQQYLRETWQRIEASVPGTRFDHSFWQVCQPRRSTWPACRAVLAAEALREGAAAAMTSAIQQAYYLQAKNPSDDAVLVALAGEIGLDEAAFSAELNSEANRQRHQGQMAQAQALQVNSYPTLLLRSGSQLVRLPLDYNDPQSTLNAIDSAIHSV
ncbi:MAG: DsbA family protein [Granulosicoccaceae bacterium]